MRNRIGLFFLLIALTGGHSLLADDLNPPSYRGAINSTSAEWDFFTDQGTEAIQPDGDTVPLVKGDAAPLLDAAFPTGALHPSGATLGDVSYSTASNGGYRGGPAGDGILVFNVPNWINDEPIKQLRLQVTYSGPAPTTLVIGYEGVPGSSDGVSAMMVDRVDVASSPKLPAGMSYFYEDWEILPNPDWEQVALFLPENTFVDQVVIDTVSSDALSFAIIFFSDFDGGNTEDWSSTVP